jgi:phosphoglucosamine mutase
MGKYFGTDGMRGVPNQKLTVDIISKMGASLESLGNKDVVLATDTRLSKDMLANAVIAGALSHGMNVHFIGVIPTPALIYYSKLKGYTGVMITASHNPYTDNGIKLLNKGYKLTDPEEAKVEELMDTPSSYNGEIGRFINESNAYSDYINFMNKHINKSSLKIAIDCANGATYKTAPEIFSKVTDNLVVVANEPNGTNINNNCGSTHLELLKETVVKNKCDLGFAFDGDGDRVLCVDNNGNTIDGDMLIYLISKYLKSKNKLNKDSVVLSIMSNLGLLHKLNDDGIKVVETPVGDKYVVRAIMENNLSIGGENSGHIIVPEYLHTGDGVLNALLVCNLLSETNTKIKDWFKDIKMYADKMVNIKVANKQNVLNNKNLFDRIDEIKKELNNDCKIIVRASGTEDLIRVSVMCKDEALMNKYSDELVKMVKEI